MLESVKSILKCSNINFKLNPRPSSHSFLLLLNTHQELHFCFVFCFWPCRVEWGIFVPWLGIEPMSPTMEMQSWPLDCQRSLLSLFLKIPLPQHWRIFTNSITPSAGWTLFYVMIPLSLTSFSNKTNFSHLLTQNRHLSVYFTQWLTLQPELLIEIFTQ